MNVTEEADVTLKIDLVMWTFQSADTLQQSLASIESSILTENVCHRILVDAGSTDRTKEIAREHGWTVHLFLEKPIARLERLLAQIDYAISLVDTEFFASFEHDILLAPEWLQRMEYLIRQSPKIGTVQGTRVTVAKGVLDATYRSRRAFEIKTQGPSFDNTLYRTEAIRKVRFSNRGDLSEDLRQVGYDWVIDRACVSGHLRPSLSYCMKHDILAWRGETYQWTDRSLPRLIFSIVKGVRIAVEYRSPVTAVAYPIYQGFKFLLAIVRSLP